MDYNLNNKIVSRATKIENNPTSDLSDSSDYEDPDVTQT